MPRTRAFPAPALLAAVATTAALAMPAAAQQRAALPEKEVALSGQPADVFSIGALDGRSWEMFGGVDAVAFDADDDLFVLDARNYRVLVYDAGGKFLRQIGKQGSGPGEIGFPVGMFLDGQGRVVIADLAQNGWSVLTPAGEHVETFPFPDGIARDVEPRPVTRRDREAARERLREQLLDPSGRSGIRMTNDNGRVSYAWADGGAPPDRATIEERVRSMTFADVIPLVAQVRTDAAGRIWIRRTGETGAADGPIDIVRANGTYVGTLRDQAVPDAASPTGFAAFIERDELDVPRLVVRRLPAGWR